MRGVRLAYREVYAFRLRRVVRIVGNRGRSP